MRNLKRVLALVMALVMALSLMVMGVSAASYTDADQIDADYSEAFEVLTNIGVIKGQDNGNGIVAAPKAILTRAEASTLVYRLLTGDVTDAQKKNYDFSSFDDVKEGEWWTGYITYAANGGYVVGDGNGKFRPEDEVTGIQVLTIMLRAIGYGQNNEYVGAGWKDNVLTDAKELGIIGSISTKDLDKGASRELVAQLLFNAITIPNMVTYSPALGYNEYQSVLGRGPKNPTLGEKNFSLACYEGYVTYSTAKKGMVLTDDAVVVVTPDQDVFDAGRYGHVWTIKDKGITKAITGVYYDDTVLATKYDGVGVNTWTNKNKKTDYVGDNEITKYFYNGAEVAADNDDLNAALGKRGVEVQLIDVDGYGKINTVIVLEQKTAQLVANPVISNDNVRIFTNNGNLPLTTDTAVGYEDLAKGSVVLYAEMADKVTYFEEAAAVSGQKTYYYSSSTDEYITFSDADYERSDLTRATDGAQIFGRAKSTFEVDATLYLDRGGYVVFTNIGNVMKSYAMIIDSYKTLSADHSSYEYYVNLLLTDGTETGYVLCNPNLTPTENTAANLAAIGDDYVLFPDALVHELYDGLGVLVRYNVKDGVYNLSYCNYDDDAALTEAYAAGGAFMEIEYDDYAITTSSVAFYYYWVDLDKDEENTPDRDGRIYYYGVNVGKGKDEGNIPAYYYGSVTPFVESTADADGDLSLNVAVLNANSAAIYADYAYIYAADGRGTTIDKETIYYYDGVLSDGSVVEFTTNTNNDWAVGQVVAYATNQRGFTTFRWVPNFKASLNQAANGTTVKVMLEGACGYAEELAVEYANDSNSNVNAYYINPGDVYDLTNTKTLKVGGTAANYDLPDNVVINDRVTARKVQAVLVPTVTGNYGGTAGLNPSDYDAVLKTAFVIDDDVIYDTFTVDGVEYYYPVTEYFHPENAIKHSLEELDDWYDAAEYHIDRIDVTPATTALVKNDAGFVFVGGGVYVTEAHQAVTYAVAAGLRNSTLNEAKDVLTVPYTTNLGTVGANKLVTVSADNATVSYAWETAPNANTKSAVLVVTLDSEDDHCDKTIKITVNKAAPDYKVVLEQDFIRPKPNGNGPKTPYTKLTVGLSDDAQYDVDNGGKWVIYRDGSVYADSTADGGDVITETTGNYTVKVFDTTGAVICESPALYVPNDGTVG